MRRTIKEGNKRRNESKEMMGGGSDERRVGGQVRGRGARHN